MSDLINKPEHYNQVGFECLDVMKAVFDKELFNGFLLGNAFKYIWRYKAKNGAEDLEKAEWYLNQINSLTLESSNHLRDQYIFLRDALRKAKGEEEPTLKRLAEECLTD